MTVAFADTFYWVALTNVSDQSHAAAIELTRLSSPLTIITSEPVLVEYLNFFAAWGEAFRNKAATNVRAILIQPNVRVVPHSSQTFEAGLQLYATRPDKGYSLTDCISMVIMHSEGVTDVLTNDRHFEQEGFRALFRDRPR